MTRTVSARFCQLLSVIIFVLQTTSGFTILPPRLSTAESTIHVKEGDTKVVLECTLDVGDDPMAYRWMKQYKLVTADLGFAYRTYHKVHLALHPITSQHAGIYECEAANEAGVDAKGIEVIVAPGGFSRKYNENDDLPDTSEVLSELAASLNDVLAEGECTCDVMFLLHASPDSPDETLVAQANFVHTVAKPIISENIRVSVSTFSDYANPKLSFGKGTDKCALTASLRNLSHEKWATRIQPVLRDALKKFKKSKNGCKILFLPIFGSLGAEGANSIVSDLLKNSGVKIFILEVTEIPLQGVEEMASTRGDSKPYHWWIPAKIWPTIVSYMAYMPEELFGCMSAEKNLEGICVSGGGNCTKSSQCEGIGFGCIQGTCQSLECNINPSLPGCCSSPGEFWCGDVSLSCKPRDVLCDGKIHCMNGLDEDRCWQIAALCQEGEARCQSSTLCLSMYDLCDGEPHCPAAEDEDPKFCRSFPCPTDRPFRCRSGKCIATDSLCDGTFRDCSDGEDENLEYCSERHVCPPTRPFKCDYGICVPERMVCDGAFNCLDALDERLCEERNCPADRPFKCGDGKCVDLALVCNGVMDACKDGLDETNCTDFVCPSDRSFKCFSGRCIDKWLECDKRDDCGDGSDETHCPHSSSPTPPPTPTLPPKPPTKVACNDDQFYCTSGACLSRDNVCDGRRNCPDGDDEEEELCRNYPCPPQRSFRCPDGACVNVTFCNGVFDCADGADETDCLGTTDTEDGFREETTNADDYDLEREADKDDNDATAIDDTSSDILIDGKPPVLNDNEPTTNLEDAMLVTNNLDNKSSGSGSHSKCSSPPALLTFALPLLALYCLTNTHSAFNYAFWTR